ncbi:hypothetical protein T484DRAFT_1886837, partial [Baffinella frigidus]
MASSIRRRVAKKVEGEGESPATLVPQRTIGEEELFFWVQRLLELPAKPQLGNFRDGVLFVEILQRIFKEDTKTVRTLALAVHTPATNLQERLDNISLVDALLREESSEDWSRDIAGVEGGASAGAVVSLLLALYRIYCRRCTTEVKRVRVRSKLPSSSGSRPPSEPRLSPANDTP